MYKEKKFFGLLALLLMGCGSMVAQSKPERGAEVKAAMGRMLMVAATAEQLTDIAQLEGVANIAIGTKPLLKLDKSRQVTHTDEVQSGTGEQLPQAYNGEGVIIGVIDSGFDCTHPVFKDENGNLRIKAVYMSGMTYTDGKGKKAVIDGKEVDGSLFDTPDMILDTLQLKQTNTFHGVHVAGCAAACPVANVKGTAQGGCRNGVHHQEWHSDRCQLPLPLPA